MLGTVKPPPTDDPELVATVVPIGRAERAARPSEEMWDAPPTLTGDGHAAASSPSSTAETARVTRRAQPRSPSPRRVLVVSLTAAAVLAFLLLIMFAGSHRKQPLTSARHPGASLAASSASRQLAASRAAAAARKQAAQVAALRAARAARQASAKRAAARTHKTAPAAVSPPPASAPVSSSASSSSPASACTAPGQLGC